MAKKKSSIDIKQFMLQKGEKVGLLIAGLAMIGLVAAGATAALKSDSPTKTADDIKGKTQQALNHIRTGPYKDSPELDPTTTKNIDISVVSLDQYRWLTELFPPADPKDAKRRNPTVLLATEFQVDRVHGPIAVHDVAEKNGKLEIAILTQQGAAAPVVNKDRKKTIYEQRLEREMKRNPQLAERIKQELTRVESIGIQNIARQAAALQEAADKWKIDYVPVDKVPDGTKLAEARYPVRMVVVTASFPYKEQLEVFRRALRLPTLDDLLKEKESIPQFLGVNVQRRELKMGGNPADESSWKDWEDVDYDKERNVRWTNYRWLLSRAIDIEADEDLLNKTVIFNKLLVMPRPRLGRNDLRYADVKLPSIVQTVANFPKDKKGASLTESVLNKKLNLQQDAFETEEQKKPEIGMEPGEAVKGKDVFVPDYCMIRFVDITVQPDKTYQYRMQVKMANPNFGKESLVAVPFWAKVDEILGDWAVVPETATLPAEKFYYAATETMELPNSSQRDKTLIQMHQYMESVRLFPDNRGSAVPIGDWVIGNVPVYRGEKISRRVDNVDVLMYFPTREAYDLVRTKGPFNRVKGMEVDFTSDDILVDFEGGAKQSYTTKSGSSRLTDNGSAELLILTGDGKLIVRNTGIDLKDSDFVKRTEEMKSKVEAAKNRGAGGVPNMGIFGPK